MVGTSIMLVGVGSAAALSPMVATRPALRQRVGLRMEVEAMPASSTNKMLDDDDLICARGVCVLPDESVAPEVCEIADDGSVACEPNPEAPAPGLNFAYLWPRALLLFSSVLYGTNFPLGRVMNEALPPSAATSARMLFAAVALSPFLFQLSPNLRKTGLLCGCFTAMGYVTQSVALVDTPAATVAFLGAVTVIVCPALAVIVDGKKLGLADAPQVWLAASLALIGVGTLELGGADGMGGVGWGDLFSVLQAVGFGTSFFITERMMAKEPDQALPITATQCAVAALVSGAWALGDGLGVNGLAGPEGGWLFDEASRAQYALPGLLLSDNVRTVCYAALWTGLVTTAANRIAETIALGRLTSAEASVLLATEPLWAALFAALYIGEELGPNDAIGGALLVSACLANAVQPQTLRGLIGLSAPEGAEGKPPADAAEEEARAPVQ